MYVARNVISASIIEPTREPPLTQNMAHATFEGKMPTSLVGQRVSCFCDLSIFPVVFWLSGSKGLLSAVGAWFNYIVLHLYVLFPLWVKWFNFLVVAHSIFLAISVHGSCAKLSRLQTAKHVVLMFQGSWVSTERLVEICFSSPPAKCMAQDTCFLFMGYTFWVLIQRQRSNVHRGTLKFGFPMYRGIARRLDVTLGQRSCKKKHHHNINSAHKSTCSRRVKPCGF